jgi:hypothetical protein
VIVAGDSVSLVGQGYYLAFGETFEGFACCFAVTTDGASKRGFRDLDRERVRKPLASRVEIAPLLEKFDDSLFHGGHPGKRDRACEV